MRIILMLLVLCLGLLPATASNAQTLDTSRFRIEWQVVNRFRLFRGDQFFRLHENAWRQYLLHVDGRGLEADERSRLVAQTSVLGSEHVLNDRYIAFSNILRKNFDWRGWAARDDADTCYDSKSRTYSGCGGIGAYVNPTAHSIELWLGTMGGSVPEGTRCEWRIDGNVVAVQSCRERVSGPNIVLPYPAGAEVSVNVVGEQPIFADAKVRDLLIAGMGDSFASGEGNPNRPVAFQEAKRYRNLYPLRAPNDASGSAVWSDDLCHRSLYGQLLRAALQIAVENPHAAVTYLDYSCSGASIEDGILGPQVYVDRVDEGKNNTKPSIRPVSGDDHDSQIYRILHDLCRREPKKRDGLIICPDGDFRRQLDFVFLSVGGNDLGFSNVVAWASLRDGVSSAIAGFLGATVSADEFGSRMRDQLPTDYARLAKAMERALPLVSAPDGIFDPSRVVLSAYPDLVTDANGDLCDADLAADEVEDHHPANQSLDMFSSWLLVRSARLAQVHAQFAQLFKRMGELAEDHQWTFAGGSYAGRLFDGHGFCAQNLERLSDPAEVLMIPCWGLTERDTQTCQSSLSAKDRHWRPYNPATQNYPYAQRQRWVRTFNDAYMAVNQKVLYRSGRISERASEAVFSETTGALHPTSEGHAAMADAIMLAIRPTLADILSRQD